MSQPNAPVRESRPQSVSVQSVSVIGAGIAGTWQALMFAKAGCGVTVYERGDQAMTLATGHWAGGMLAPYCESEAAEPLITRLGLRSLDLWREELPGTPFSIDLDDPFPEIAQVRAQVRQRPAYRTSQYLIQGGA